MPKLKDLVLKKKSPFLIKKKNKTVTNIVEDAYFKISMEGERPYTNTHSMTGVRFGVIDHSGADTLSY